MALIPPPASICGSRSTIESLTDATSRGSGTPTSSCSRVAVRRVVCAGTRAPEMAVRLKYAGIPDAALRSRSRSTARSTARLPRRTDGCSPSPPTRPCSSFAICSPGAAWRELLGMSTRRPSGTRSNAAAMRADLDLWERLAERGRRAVLELGCGTRAGRPPPRRARATRSGRWIASPALIEALEPRRPRRGVEIATVCADVRALELEREFELDHRPDAARADAGRQRGRATRRWRRRGASRARRAAGGRRSSSDPAASVEGAGPAAPGRARAGRLGVLEPPAVVSTEDGGLEIRRLRQIGRPGGAAAATEAHTDRLEAWTPETLEAEAADGGLASREPDSRLRPGRLPRLHRRGHGGGRDGASLVALYPEQMNIYADRGNILFLRRRCEWRGIGFSYTRVGARRAARSRRARPDLHRRRPGPRPADRRRATWSRPSARPRGGGRRRRRRARGVRRLPAPRAQLPARRGADAGLGLADLETVREPGPRLIGNVEIEVDLGDGPQRLAGFENHGGRTYLGVGRRAAGPGDSRVRQQRPRTGSRGCGGPT